MGVRLRDVPAAAGARWIRNGFATFALRPAVFIGLFAATLLGELIGLQLPVVGSLLVALTLPLVSLAFMMVTAWTLADRPEHHRLAVTPLAATRAQRRGLAGVCAVYVTGTILVSLAFVAAGGDSLWAYLDAMSRVDAQHLAQDAMPAPDTRALWSIVVGYAGMTVVSLLTWHAPALVHWGGQGAAQSLFSNAVAIWHTRSAFLVYAIGWTTLACGVLLVTMLLALVGLTPVASLLLLPVMVLLFTVFYVSLYFCFADTFEIVD
jgi:hypothetical protein